MLQTDLSGHEMNGDPAPNVASDAEIEFAERLRRQLEERYLSRSAAPPALPERPISHEATGAQSQRLSLSGAQ